MSSPPKILKVAGLIHWLQTHSMKHYLQHYGDDETAKDEERVRYYGHTQLL